MYLRGKEIWNAKMSEDLKIQIVSKPGKSSYSDERGRQKMSKLNQIVEMLCNLRNSDWSVDDISKAAYIIEEPVEDLAIREYLKMKDTNHKFLQYDAFGNTYKRKSVSEYEQMRQLTLLQIENEKDIYKQVELLLSRSKEIKEGIQGIYYNDRFRECCKIPFMIAVCKNMILAGASLTEIVKYVPESMMGDIYHLAKDHLGLHIELTEDERKEVEKYDNEPEEKKVRVMTAWRRLFGKGIPHEKDGRWTLDDDDKSYDSYEMACLYAGCELSYPYYEDGTKNPKYVDTFEEVLEKVMLFPEDISIEGLEMAYGPQEYHLVMTLRKKLLEEIAKVESELK